MFVEVTGKKLVDRGAFCPPVPHPEYGSDYIAFIAFFLCYFFFGIHVFSVTVVCRCSSE